MEDNQPEDAAAAAATAAADARYQAIKQKEKDKNRRYYQSRREEILKKRGDRLVELMDENTILRDRVEQLERQLVSCLEKDRLIGVTIEQLYEISRNIDVISSI